MTGPDGLVEKGTKTHSARRVSLDAGTAADKRARSARRIVLERDEQRAEQKQRYLDACRDLPAAQAAHASFQARVVAAEHVVTEATSNLWNAERDLRNAGKLQRRSARRNVAAANDVLAIAAERVTRCEQAAEPTHRPLNGLRDIVDHHDRTHSTRELLDDYTTSTIAPTVPNIFAMPSTRGSTGRQVASSLLRNSATWSRRSAATEP